MKKTQSREGIQTNREGVGVPSPSPTATWIVKNY